MPIRCGRWRPIDRVVFVNADLRLIVLFLRFLSVMGVGEDRVFFRIYIHESADVAASEAWWAGRLGASASRFKRTVLKRHNPLTRRRNAGSDYHGCLAIEVARSRDLYWRIEGIVARVDEGT